MRKRTEKSQIESKMIRNFRLAVLRAFAGNRTKAAEWLGISVRALRGQLAIYRAQGILIEKMARGGRIDRELLERLERRSEDDSPQGQE